MIRYLIVDRKQKKEKTQRACLGSNGLFSLGKSYLPKFLQLPNKLPPPRGNQVFKDELVKDILYSNSKINILSSSFVSLR